jgi:small subunit ribosomal protein S17
MAETKDEKKSPQEESGTDAVTATEATQEPTETAAPAEEATAPAEEASPEAAKPKSKAKKAAKPAQKAITPEERAQKRAEKRQKLKLNRQKYRAKLKTKRASQRSTKEDSAVTVEPAATSSGTQKVRMGVVVSDKADQTITVRIDFARRHRRYRKIVRSSTNLHAHDAINDAKIGDTVRIIECRPLSRTKRWRLVEVVERAR